MVDPSIVGVSPILLWLIAVPIDRRLFGSHGRMTI
jgi:hypothetical protein